MDYVDRLRSFYAGNYIFDHAIRIIEKGFDLNLTTIEMVKLIYHSKAAFDDLVQIEIMKNSFNQAKDAVARFFYYEYGIPPNDPSMFNLLIRGIRDNAFNAYLKILQDRMHFDCR